MPAGQPFTLLCLRASAAGRTRADLHVHSTASDGRYTPEQVVEVAARCGLAAVALTDHDTLAGYGAARAAAPRGLEVIPAVELTAELDGREVHLLGYFVRPDDVRLTAALDRLRHHRSGRFDDMVQRLRGCGVALPDRAAPPNASALGRRHLAELLVGCGLVGSVREAFNRYLDSGKPAYVQTMRFDLHEAIALVHGAGGVCSLAHPPTTLDLATLAALRSIGLDAVEAVYPSFKNSRTARLREYCQRLGLLVTGGSDCHGPDEPKRAMGCRTVSRDELAALRRRAAQPQS
jgi:hypothetical protein